MNTLKSLDGLRILVVDDDADTLVLVRFIFEEYNVQVSSTSSTREAFEVIRCWEPDILLSDIALPEEDGYCLISKVRKLPGKIGQIPALALTALATQEARRKILNSGFSVYVVKPFEPDSLVEVVSNLAIERACYVRVVDVEENGDS